MITALLWFATITPAVERQQWAGRFGAMALALPALEAGEEPSRALPYKRFYGLDIPGSRWRIGTVKSKGLRIAVQVFHPKAPPSGTVLVLHGYLDHMGTYGPLIRRLTKEGYRVVLFDLPGHGLSSGARAGLAGIDDYVQALRSVQRAVKRLPVVDGPVHYIGHSTGAAVLLQELDAGRLKGGHSILLAPLVRWVHFRKSRWAKAVVGLLAQSVPRRFRRSSSDAAFMRFIRETDPLQQRRIPMSWLNALTRWHDQFVKGGAIPGSVTILQGTRDGTVHWKYNLKVLRRRLPQAQVVVLEGADHHLVNESEPMRSKALVDIAKSLAQPIPVNGPVGPGPASR